MARCNSWIPTTTTPGQDPSVKAGWRMCRNRVAARGQRCAECWDVLATHPYWPVREALARELADTDHSGDDPILVETAWMTLQDDPDQDIRQALIGPHTPRDVLFILASDQSATVRALTHERLGLDRGRATDRFDAAYVG